MTTNLWATLKALLPGDQLLIGQVIAVASFGATVRLPDGSHINVRGNAQLGQQVFIRAGLIECSAPSLPVEVIEI